MLPLRDANPSRTTPVVNYLLIALNIVMFLWELSLGPRIERVLFDVAFVPARFWIAGAWIPDAFAIFVSMFLHGGFLHIGSNMLYLWIFGDNVEDRLGHGRYFLFYILCGVGATLAHALSNPSSQVPAVGASGAIAGVLGAYLILYPRAQVMTLIPIFMFVTIRELPAVILLGLWFVLQLFSGVGSLGTMEDNMGGVAYFAHIGGFVLGMLLIVMMGGMRRRRPAQVRRVDDWPL